MIRIIAAGILVLLVYAACGGGDRLDPPGDGSVALGLECDGDYPAERADYYVGAEINWYEAAQICLDCPDWPYRVDADTCARRALEKFD